MNRKTTLVSTLLGLAAFFAPTPSAADDAIGGEGRGNRLILEGLEQDPTSTRTETSATTTNSNATEPNRTSERQEAGFRPNPWFIENCVITQTTIDCPEAERETPTPARRQLTEGDVRRAVSEIPMPQLDVRVQPDGRTLVNVPTILSTDPDPVRESITLLGRDVQVEATPTGFTWHHGDGTSRTTTRPGRPYPHRDVTHTYRRTADDLRLRVDTTYTVRYRVDDGDWTPLGTTLTATGTPSALDVDEAAPVLVRRR